MVKSLVPYGVSLVHARLFHTISRYIQIWIHKHWLELNQNGLWCMGKGIEFAFLSILHVKKVTKPYQ